MVRSDDGVERPSPGVSNWTGEHVIRILTATILTVRANRRTPIELPPVATPSP